MQKNTGLKRIRLAGVYAFNGLVAAFRHEAAFRQELLLALVCIPVALTLDVERTERILLIIVTVLVLIAELVNSAVEAVVDRIGVEYHELSGRAKDMGSGAVLVSLLLWAYVWIDIVVIGVWFSTGQL
ncbi:MAG: diacylglycerol kinase [Granulosicoccus sp.]